MYFDVANRRRNGAKRDSGQSLDWRHGPCARASSMQPSRANRTDLKQRGGLQTGSQIGTSTGSKDAVAVGLNRQGHIARCIHSAAKRQSQRPGKQGGRSKVSNPTILLPGQGTPR